jgi:hypothetical protein
MRVLVTGAADATSGFRAYSREAALNRIVVNRYADTIESTIQAGLGSLRTTWVPVRANPQTRESRLIRATFGYVRRDALTISRVFAREVGHRTLVEIRTRILNIGDRESSHGQ